MAITVVLGNQSIKRVIYQRLEPNEVNGDHTLTYVSDWHSEVEVNGCHRVRSFGWLHDDDDNDDDNNSNNDNNNNDKDTTTISITLTIITIIAVIMIIIIMIIMMMMMIIMIMIIMMIIIITTIKITITITTKIIISVLFRDDFKNAKRRHAPKRLYDVLNVAGQLSGFYCVYLRANWLYTGDGLYFDNHVPPALLWGVRNYDSRLHPETPGVWYG